MAVHADQETAEAEGSGKASMQKTQDSYNHLRRRSFADCENGRLPLQHWWVEKRHSNMDTLNSLQSVWKPLKNQSECCMQHENSSRVRRKLKGYLRDLRTTWHHPAAWHHPGAMDTRIVKQPVWCRSCKVSVKCLLTHTCPPWFAAFLEVT